MKRLLCALFALMLASCLVNALAENDEAQLTLFVYITGSDLESSGGAATRDITEMLRSGVDAEKVNILLMTGGSKKWWGGFPNDQVCIYRAAGARPELLCQTNMASMGKPETLEQFLDYGYENYPAEQYALILWDHGGGPLEGVCYDELFGSDSLSMKELSTALEAGPFGADNKLEWIGFDACLMSSVETAYTCAPYARYMIASQETEPGTGWNYSFLKGLEAGADGAEVGRRIVDGYFEAAEENTEDGLTLACLDLGKVEAIEQAMDALFGELDAIISPESFSMLSNSRRDTKNFGRSTTGSDYDLVDLYHLALQYALVAPEGSDALLSAIEDAVVYQRSAPENSNGLSVYYPYYNKQRYESIWEETYRELGFSAGYTKYMEDYADLWLGDSLADWKGLRTVGLQPEDGMQELMLELTEDQAAHFASAELYILGEYGSDNAYYDLYHMDGISLDGQSLSAKYAYQALYALDGDGNILTDALTYIRRDDCYLVRATLSNVCGQEDMFELMDDDTTTVYLQCKPVEGTDELQVVGLIEIPVETPFTSMPEEDVLLTGKQTLTLDPDDWQWIQFTRWPRLKTEDADGTPLPYSQWSYPSERVGGSLIMEYYSVDNRAPWTLKFCEQQNSGRSLWAQYVVTDTQGERFASELLPIENPNLVDHCPLEQPLFHEDGLDITLSAIDAIDVKGASGASVRFGVTSMAFSSAKNEAGLYLRTRVINNTDDLIYMNMEKISFDETAINYTVSRDDPLAKDAEILLIIPENEFPPLEDAGIHHFQFELTVRNSVLEEIVRVPIQIDAEIDLQGLGPRITSALNPLTTTVVDDATYELLSLEEQGDGSMLAEILIDNQGTDALEQEWYQSDFAVNGCVIDDGCHGERFTVPSQRRLFTKLRFDCWADTSSAEEDSSYISEIHAPQFSEPNDFAYWDIEQIQRLAILPLLDTEEKRVDFVLDASVKLSRPVQRHDEVPLFSADGIAVLLREMRIVDGKLCLYVTLQNQTDSEVEFAIMQLRLNGGTEKYVFLESDNWNSNEETYTVKPNLTWRVALKFSLDDAELTSAFEDLRIDFGYLREGNWHYISKVLIKPKAPCLVGDLANVRLSASELALDVGEAVDPESTLIDPLELFAPELKMPENASQYRTSLAAKLTPDQARDFQEGMLVLAFCDEDSYRICYTQKDLELDSDGWLHADFDGLLVRVPGEEGPVIAYKVEETEDMLELELRGLSLEATLFEAKDALFQNVYVEIDRAKNSARILKIEAEREINSQERFSSLLYLHKRRIPAYDESGTLKHVDDWESGNLTGYYCDLKDDFARLEVCPASDYPLYAVFCVRDVNGYGYSLEPVRYNDAKPHASIEKEIY